eukprot:5037906-Prymnesium_polylepis.1
MTNRQDPHEEEYFPCAHAQRREKLVVARRQSAAVVAAGVVDDAVLLLERHKVEQHEEAMADRADDQLDVRDLEEAFRRPFAL